MKDKIIEGRKALESKIADLKRIDQEWKDEIASLEAKLSGKREEVEPLQKQLDEAKALAQGAKEADLNDCLIEIHSEIKKLTSRIKNLKFHVPGESTWIAYLEEHLSFHRDIHSTPQTDDKRLAPSIDSKSVAKLSYLLVSALPLWVVSHFHLLELMELQEHSNPHYVPTSEEEKHPMAEKYRLLITRAQVRYATTGAPLDIEIMNGTKKVEEKDMYFSALRSAISNIASKFGKKHITKAANKVLGFNEAGQKVG